jgi:hypothetical protein
MGSVNDNGRPLRSVDQVDAEVGAAWRLYPARCEQLLQDLMETMGDFARRHRLSTDAHYEAVQYGIRKAYKRGRMELDYDALIGQVCRDACDFLKRHYARVAKARARSATVSLDPTPGEAIFDDLYINPAELRRGGRPTRFRAAPNVGQLDETEELALQRLGYGRKRIDIRAAGRLLALAKTGQPEDVATLWMLLALLPDDRKPEVVAQLGLESDLDRKRRLAKERKRQQRRPAAASSEAG